MAKKVELLSLKEYLLRLRELEAQRPRHTKRVFPWVDRPGERFEFLFESLWNSEVHEDLKIILSVTHHYDGEEKHWVRIPLGVLQEALSWLGGLFSIGILERPDGCSSSEE